MAFVSVHNLHNGQGTKQEEDDLAATKPQNLGRASETSSKVSLSQIVSTAFFQKGHNVHVD